MRYAFLWALLCPLASFAQVVNGYAEVTGISTNVLTVGTSNETAATFTVGKQVVIMQMQDNVIGANTANNSNFGDLSNIQRAGLYSVRTIAAVTRSGPTLTSITLDAVPGISFNINANAAVQAITFELLSSGDYTTVAAMSALAWNGAIGGVLAVQVPGTLTLMHNITADGAGFRGGARDRWNYTSPCNTTDYVWSGTAAGTEYFATKGEGIYKNTNVALTDGRGKMLNGGGGANQINAGGGGGGNFTAGGSAVLGWSCGADAGGIGGLSLGANVSASRVFMGGGGGGGEGNDDVSTDGMNGGGIILIKAGQLITSGPCASRRISADGLSAANSGNDGAGAGGAGGSIVLSIPLYWFDPACTLTISANGGSGGSVNSSTHGGGAGGGQGAIIFSTPVPTGNVSISTQNGQGGCNETPCITRAGSGSGSNNVGIIPNTDGPLPIELIRFAAVAVGQRVELDWSTATETGNASFVVQRSVDLQAWQDVVFLPGALNSQTQIDYSAMDDQPLPHTSYYRLGQTDVDGTSSWSDAVPVYFGDLGAGALQLFPNPAEHDVLVVHQALGERSDLRVFDAVGRTIQLPLLSGIGSATLDVSGLLPGSYVVQLQADGKRYVQRLVVRASAGR